MKLINQISSQISSTHWGDILCVLLLVIFSCQGAMEWFTSDPLMFFLLFSCVLFIIIASIRLVLLNAKRSLRDWIYPIYGILLLLIEFFYMYSMISWRFSVIELQEVAAFFFSLTIYFILVSSLVRLIVRLVKRRKQKALEAHNSEEEANLDA